MNALANALQGTKVLDFSQGIAGPHAACLLGEMGAEVVKVEPPAGDWVRGLGVRRDGSSVLYGTFNRGKRGLCLDLKERRARDAARRLIAQADVMLESNRPGVMAKLGLDYDSVRAENRRLVYVSVTGFGQTGPYVERPATDAVIQAYTGFAFGAADMVEPVRVRIALIDVVTGIYASHAVLGALLQRARSGEGQYLDLSLMHAITAVQGYKYAEYEASGGALPREVLASVGLFRTADGYLALSATREQQLIDLLGLIGREDLLRDDRFATPAARMANQEALRALIADRLSEKPTAHWIPRMQALDLLCQEVLTYDAYRRDPQVLHQQLFQATNLGAVGSLPAVRMPGLPAGAAAPAPAPALGEHGAEVLRRAGFEPDEIAELLGGRSGSPAA